MAQNVKHVSHKKSKLVVGGKPQLPSPDIIIEGEIAVNYAKGVETLSIKNESGDVVTFSSDNYYNATKLGSGFTGVNSAKTVTDAINEVSSGSSAVSELSGTVTAHTANTEIHVTSSDKATWSGKQDALESGANIKTINGESILGEGNITVQTDGYTKEEIDNFLGSAVTSADSVTKIIEDNELVVSSALNDLYTNKQNISGMTAYTTTATTNELSGTVNTHTADTNVHFTGDEKVNLDSLATNIRTISGISADDVGHWNDAVNNSHTHENRVYLDSITGNVGTMAYQNTSSYSSATEVNAAISDVNNTIEILSGAVEDDELVISTALNDINTRIGSGFSGIDLTEAVEGKADASHVHVSSVVTAMTGYVVASASGDVSTSDSLNEAIGKLEKRIQLLEALILTKENVLIVTGVTGEDYYEIKN